MAKTVPPFTAGQLEALCRELGETMTGTQMDRLLPAASINDSSLQSTNWKRLYESLARRQNQDGNGNAVCRFIKVAMAPGRFGSERERFEAHREGLNLTLGFVGLELRENGKLYPAAPTTTLPRRRSGRTHSRPSYASATCTPTYSRFVAPS
jgi:hypothetical protein